jgi:hypothetical protein
MMADLLPAVFTLDIDGKPALTFEAKNLREAWEVCHERWLHQDIARLRSNETPLWDGKAPLRSRYASEAEIAVYRQSAVDARQTPGDLVLVYLVELDGVAETDSARARSA